MLSANASTDDVTIREREYAFHVRQRSRARPPIIQLSILYGTNSAPCCLPIRARIRSATTLRRPRHEWMAVDVMHTLLALVWLPTPEISDDAGLGTPAAGSLHNVRVRRIDSLEGKAR